MQKRTPGGVLFVYIAIRYLRQDLVYPFFLLLVLIQELILYYHLNSLEFFLEVLDVLVSVVVFVF